MSTWHQNKQPVELWHPTKYVVVTNPQGGTLTRMLWDTLEQAQTYLDNLRKNNQKDYSCSYLVPPTEKV